MQKDPSKIPYSAEEKVNENAEIGNTLRADQLNPEDDDEFINVARTNNCRQTMTLRMTKSTLSSSNEVQRVYTAEEAAVLAAQLTAERVKEALKAELTVAHQSNDERQKKLELLFQGLQKENDIKIMNAKSEPSPKHCVAFDPSFPL